MPTRDITIINRLGLHARAASKFVALASQFDADIKLRRNNREVNGKSIMGVMMLAAGKGTELTLIAEGSDADDALNALEELVQARFEEAE
ncbi:phosphocarrier protein HPr [Alkalilimnicola ehrlichii]|uniref:Phosphocarrier protein HPr n=1 Tax=Alkalilimnicola ehrlichii TaxID=351052 RepID=A0A3E0WXX2_9GAMM|nr:HPr family phosphocarrier protein [Alkalilimnicola ehrlichii]RFA30281.1 phosphocarrier protein HPr [Alkalilimnicola ehrlichii]RFA37860.1 phosphocarrier protein HPr [Alkalilimnicola ehrlichii]